MFVGVPILVHTREKNQPPLPELPGFKIQYPLNSPLTKPPLLLLAQAQPTRNIGVYVLCSPARGWSNVALKHEAHPIDGASWLLDGGTRYICFFSVAARKERVCSSVFKQTAPPPQDHQQCQQCGSRSSSRQRSTGSTSSRGHSNTAIVDAVGRAPLVSAVVGNPGGCSMGARGQEPKRLISFFPRERVRERERQRPERRRASLRHQCIRHSTR